MGLNAFAIQHHRGQALRTFAEKYDAFDRLGERAFKGMRRSISMEIKDLPVEIQNKIFFYYAEHPCAVMVKDELQAIPRVLPFLVNEDYFYQFREHLFPRMHKLKFQHEYPFELIGRYELMEILAEKEEEE